MSSKTKNWTEEDFRKELRRLDAMVQEKQGITLVGAEFEIQFMNTRRTLGYYYPTQKRFRFSLPFFNSDVPENCALDVIRHEYAHYYAHAVYGYRGVHGKPFKEACIAVGAKRRKDLPKLAVRGSAGRTSLLRQRNDPGDQKPKGRRRPDRFLSRKGRKDAGRAMAL